MTLRERLEATQRLVDAAFDEAERACARAQTALTGGYLLPSGEHAPHCPGCVYDRLKAQP